MKASRGKPRHPLSAPSLSTLSTAADSCEKRAEASARPEQEQGRTVTEAETTSSPPPESATSCPAQDLSEELDAAPTGRSSDRERRRPGRGRRRARERDAHGPAPPPSCACATPKDASPTRGASERIENLGSGNVVARPSEEARDALATPRAGGKGEETRIAPSAAATPGEQRRRELPTEGDARDNEERRTFPSKLDFFDPNSDIARSEFRGIAVLLLIAALYYLFANPILRWYDSKEFVDPSLARAMFDDFFFLMFMWAKLFAWSFTAYQLHVLYLRGRLSRGALLFLQHLTQSAAIGYAVCSCLYNAWPIIPAAFVQMISVVQFMKMHSYSATNMNFCDEMRAGKLTPGYPENVTLRNFCDYLLCPVLVYEPAYRRGGGFRPAYFVCKFFSMLGAMVVMYLACTSYLIPTMMRSPTMSLTQAVFSLVFPFLFLDILVFYIIFECICNLAAEVTNFANRNFYDDWWNSTNWDEYSRKWNKPVHRFLLRHVYMETQQRYKWSHRTASFATFLFSALLHEMILAVCFRFVRLYLFGLMLLQIPLIALGRHYRHKKFVANGIFWACLMLGPPLLGLAYGREWAKIHFYAAHADHQPLRLF
ncbi:acyl-CoA:cholesterol acyltransferase alpha ACAT1-alpha [Besnoitia besnoiti]|uniref:Acyl-CoA:cholesterol acyltransferase alpha ACAT1-alpha n=1 Tax=Besnoitia besnoiti TaxID=94643 RepID=A0A2A9MPF2_BESBE|nr:acyl-CoA:cholesterol acyltransferase alpha ACAT1-alpha [Besnoitia besnoiti]PFH37700.1 acyl-CoA:cholesterol acyltransferase alpha ACAT1-alpha [Besnoitia besnoiti]